MVVILALIVIRGERRVVVLLQEGVRARTTERAHLLLSTRA